MEVKNENKNVQFKKRIFFFKRTKRKHRLINDSVGRSSSYKEGMLNDPFPLFASL